MLQDLIERHGIYMNVNGDAKLDYDKQNDWQRNANSYSLTLVRQVNGKSRRMSLDFWQGTGISGEPKLDGVLDCLLADACIGDNYDLDQFVYEFGYKASEGVKTFKKIQSQTAKLRKFLGEDYETFVQEER